MRGIAISLLAAFVLFVGPLLGPTWGGTGINSSALTGVAQVNAGAWSVSTGLASGTTATTQAALNGSTLLATTAYVDNQRTLNTYCGTTTTCSNTLLANPLKIVQGSVTLSGGTATVTGIPAFTSVTTTQCSCEDNTAPTQACEAHLLTTTSVIVNGNSTNTDEYRCIGN